MHGIGNHLPIKADADWAMQAEKFERVATELKSAYPKIRVAQLLKVGPQVGILSLPLPDVSLG